MLHFEAISWEKKEHALESDPSSLLKNLGFNKWVISKIQSEIIFNFYSLHSRSNINEPEEKLQYHKHNN